MESGSGFTEEFFSAAPASPLKTYTGRKPEHLEADAQASDDTGILLIIGQDVGESYYGFHSPAQLKEFANWLNTVAVKFEESVKK